MGANDLKKLYENMPKGVKTAFAPLFVRVMVRNPVFKETWERIDEFERADSEKKEEMQLEALRSTLTYAYENVPFYRKRFDEAGLDPYAVNSLRDIEKLPLLEKDEAIAAGDSIHSTDGSLDFYETFTGGSSGQALRVLLDKKSIYAERAFVCHFLSKFGYDPLKTRTVALWGHNKDADYYYSPLKNEIVISPFRLFDESQTEAVCHDIEEFGAEFLMGYPSAITQLARRVRERGIELKFEHVVYYAENYSAEDKAIAEETFHCPADSYYGHTERAVFAEITDDGCVFNDAYGYTELMPTDTPGEFRVVCTGFLSRKMPLIRYATDDHVVAGDDGRMSLVGHKRSDTYLVAKGGARIFKGAMTLHVPELKSIVRYQYHQHEAGKAELWLMVSGPLSDAEESHLRNYLDRRCEGMLDVEIKYVDSIELTARGKERWAIVDKNVAGGGCSQEHPPCCPATSLRTSEGSVDEGAHGRS